MPEKVHPGDFKAVEVLIRDIQTLANRARILGMIRTANALNAVKNAADWEFAAQILP